MGAATVTLNGGTLSPWGNNHLFSNPLVLNSGFIDNQGFFNTYSGPVQVNGPLQVNAINGGNISFNGNLSGAGSIRKIGSYSVFFGGDNGGFTGSYTNDESNAFFTSDNSGSAAAAWVVNTGIFAGFQPGARTIQLGSLAGAGGTVANNLANPDTGELTLVIGSNNLSTVFSGQILDTVNQAGTVAIIKAGTGSLTLAGPCAHSGVTLVQSGVLRIDGTVSASTVTVAGGALGGNGTILTPVTVQAAGTLEPGASVGVLTVSNTLSLGGTALLEIDKANGTNDLVRGLSTVTYGGTLRVTNLGGVLADGDTFKLFEASSYTGYFSTFDLPSLTVGLEWNPNRLLVDGSIKVGPPNNPPSALDRTLGALVNQSATMEKARLLLGATDPDNDVLFLLSVSATSTNGGTVAVVGTNVVYTPASNYVGTDAFTFTISDGRGGTAVGTVLVSVTNGQTQNIVGASYDSGAGAMIITFAGIPGYSYRVQYATTLTPPADWADLSTNLVPPAGIFSITNVVGESTNRFYRTVHP